MSGFPRGGSSKGSPIVRKFPFTYNSPGIATGLALFTPAVGDILLDAWFEVDTAWDGVTPQGDIGTFVGADGLFEGHSLPVDMTSNWGPYAGTFLASGTNSQSFSSVSINQSPPPQVETWQLKFTTGDPVKVMVSQDGTTGSTPSSFDSTTPPPVLPLVVAAGVSDQYNFTLQRGTPAPDQFTVTAGSYTTTALLAVALNAATDGAAHVFSATYGTWADDGSGNLQLTLLAPGANSSTVTAGTDDIVVHLGLSTATTTGGAGGDPGSTQGAGSVYVVTVTPA